MTIHYFIITIHSLFAVSLNNSSNTVDTNKITIVGRAIVIKHHAAVRTDDSLLYYLNGIYDWDEKYKGKRVSVTGKLDRKETPPFKNPFPDITAIPQPILSDGQYLKKAKWKLVKELHIP